MKKDITELYCCVEDFCCMVDENFANMLVSNGRKPTRIPGFQKFLPSSYYTINLHAKISKLFTYFVCHFTDQNFPNCQHMIGLLPLSREFYGI